ERHRVPEQGCGLARLRYGRGHSWSALRLRVVRLLDVGDRPTLDTGESPTAGARIGVAPDGRVGGAWRQAGDGPDHGHERLREGDRSWPHTALPRGSGCEQPCGGAARGSWVREKVAGHQRLRNERLVVVVVGVRPCPAGAAGQGSWRPRPGARDVVP